MNSASFYIYLGVIFVKSEFISGPYKQKVCWSKKYKINSRAESSMLTVSKFLKFKCNNDEKSNCLYVLRGWICGETDLVPKGRHVHILGRDFHQ